MIQVRGWVIDRDLATPGRVHAYVDNAATLVPAARPRTDVGKQFPLYGPNHGYDKLIPATPGVHGVCLYGIDVSGPGGNTTLGCRIVTVGGSPFGSLDTVRTAPGQVRVTGWVIDRDSASPGTVHVYVDGSPTAISAAGVRNDIGGAFPLYGSGHGFDSTITDGSRRAPRLRLRHQHLRTRRQHDPRLPHRHGPRVAGGDSRAARSVVGAAHGPGRDRHRRGRRARAGRRPSCSPTSGPPSRSVIATPTGSPAPRRASSRVAAGCSAACSTSATATRSPAFSPTSRASSARSTCS